MLIPYFSLFSSTLTTNDGQTRTKQSYDKNWTIILTPPRQRQKPKVKTKTKTKAETKIRKNTKIKTDKDIDKDKDTD